MDCDIKEKFTGTMNKDYFCYVCDKLAIDRFHNNHLESQTHINNFRKTQELNNTHNLTSFSTTKQSSCF